ncbi:MAG: deoxynucleoside kinase [Anaerolineae bacterium]|nr:deoxynucleoside kinase [Anaerolineae bacterium]
MDTPRRYSAHPALSTGKYFVLVAGNIGAGKTTITDRLATRLGWESAYETVASNPFLPDFYADMCRWSFHLQVYFLGDRAAQHRQMARHPNSAIIDRSIYEDAHIFARALHMLGNMTEREIHAYRQLYDQMMDGLPRPDLLLYLKADVPVLMERIRSRARAMESGITPEYLGLLNSYYEEWISGFNVCPVLTIPADNLNFATNDAHLSIIIERIEQTLTGREEVVFPDDIDL